MISNQLTAWIMPSEKAPVAFKLKTAQSLQYKNVHQIVIFVILLDLSVIRSRYVRSIRPMLGDWERYFSCRPFCLTRRQTWYLEVCLSAVCVVWCRNNNRKYMTRLKESYVVFLGYLNQLEKIRKCLFDRISSPLERKTLYVPPSPLEICLF